MTEDQIAALAAKLKHQFGNALISKAIDPFIRTVESVIDDLEQNGLPWHIGYSHDFIGSKIFLMSSDKPGSPKNFLLQSTDGLQLDVLNYGVRTKIKAGEDIVPQIKTACSLNFDA